MATAINEISTCITLSKETLSDTSDKKYVYISKKRLEQLEYIEKNYKMLIKTAVILSDTKTKS